MPVEILSVDEYADYLSDESRRTGTAETICFPKSADEVQDAVQTASENDWPITVQGGRTGITGGCVPEGGMILNLSRMKAIGAVKSDLMRVEPGATLADIRAAVSALGDRACIFPPDLTETTATIGGMVANNASGARSFKYGAVRNWIHALEVVLPNGELVSLERGCNQADGVKFELGKIQGCLPQLSYFQKYDNVKSAAGYVVKPDMDLVDLFVGAEGTLGIVTGITIKLFPKPQQMNGLTAFFDSEAKALEFVQLLRGTGTDISGSTCAHFRKCACAAIEFFDSNALALLRRMKLENPAFSYLPELKPEYDTCIYFEFDDDVPDEVIEQVDERALACWFSEGEHEIATLKNFRHAIPEAVNMLIGERKKTIPELTKLGTDMSVPDEHLEDVMRMYHDGLAGAGLEFVIFGHIGNNHVHVNILPRSMEEFEQGKALYLAWAKKVVEWGGSVSAEHGIGKNKTEFLKLMYGEIGIVEMKQLKLLFDPRNMLNRGNLFGD